MKTRYAVIVPSAMVSDRLRYTEDINKLPPATDFLKQYLWRKAFSKELFVMGCIVSSPIIVRVAATCHNNLHGDVVNMGAIYTDQDVVVDGDLVTGRGAHCHLFAKKIIEMLAEH